MRRHSSGFFDLDFFPDERGDDFVFFIVSSWEGSSDQLFSGVEFRQDFIEFGGCGIGDIQRWFKEVGEAIEGALAGDEGHFERGVDVGGIEDGDPFDFGLDDGAPGGFPDSAG